MLKEGDKFKDLILAVDAIEAYSKQVGVAMPSPEDIRDYVDDDEDVDLGWCFYITNLPK